MQNPYVTLCLSEIGIEVVSPTPIRSRHKLTSSLQSFQVGIISTNYSENERVAQGKHAVGTGTSREEDIFQEGLASRQTLLTLLW